MRIVHLFDANLSNRYPPHISQIWELDNDLEITIVLTTLPSLPLFQLSKRPCIDKMEHPPVRSNPIVVEDATAPSHTSSDSLASDGVQTGSSQSCAQVNTPDPTCSTNNGSQAAACKTAEENDEMAAAEATADAESKNNLIQELQPDSESDGHSDGSLVHKLSVRYYQSKYESLDNHLEKRMNKATRLAIQSNLYAQLVEDRLKQLEKDVRMILRKPLPKNEEDEISKNVMKPLPHRQVVNHLTWTAWSAPVVVPKALLARPKWKHGLEVDGIPKSVIEILIEEPQVAVRYFNRNEPSPVIDPSLWVPWRIRFRSKLMLKLLERVTGQRVSIGPHKHQVVLLRPFKLLVAYADKIFSFCQDLEDKDAAGLLIAGK